MVPRPEDQAGLVCILLVEDDVLVRFATADYLRDSGLTVIEAASADEALSYIGTGGRADLVFTDIEMPGSMNGLDLARRLKTENPTLPIILTSGKVMSQNTEAIGLFLAKPYMIGRAVSLVLDMLGVKPVDGGE